MNKAVLFVDDEPNILKAIHRLFRGEEFSLHTAESGAAALEILDTKPIQVIVSDHRMPGMTGVDLLSKVRERWPDVIRILVTGNSEMNIAVDAIKRGEIYRLIRKPWSDEEIRATVGEALDLHLLKVEIKRLNYLTQEQNLKLQNLHQNLERTVTERTQEIYQRNVDLSEAYMSAIRSLVEAIDGRQGYATNHSERVGIYSGMLARQMGLGEARAQRIYIAGILHDIGKIGISDEILLKPGPLLEAEAQEVRRYPLLSAQILRSVPWLQDILPAIRHHREWFDGDKRGYPDRLKGDAIDSGARIIQVADAIDAMSSNRPYRRVLPPERVKEELKKSAGTQFDPEIIEGVFALLERERGLFEQPPLGDFFKPDLAFPFPQASRP